MTYETIAGISQTAALLFFIAMTVSVIVYAFWPGNRRRFEEAQRRALDLEGKADNRSGR